MHLLLFCDLVGLNPTDRAGEENGTEEVDGLLPLHGIKDALFLFELVHLHLGEMVLTPRFVENIPAVTLLKIFDGLLDRLNTRGLHDLVKLRRSNRQSE